MSTTDTSTTTSSQSAFRLDDLSSTWGQGIWKLTFDLPGEKVNKFSEGVMTDFANLLDELDRKKNDIRGLILVSGKAKNFIAGADIKLIQSAGTFEKAEELSRKGQKYLDRWEDLPFVKVVAINGTTMGGGCELSLASTAILMSTAKEAKIGLPEVLLGVIPGMGGCVRMPAKVGIATALDLILTGKTLDGQRAYRTGLADACIPKENFEESAIRWMVKNLDALKQGKRFAKQPKLGGMGGTLGSIFEGNPVTRSVIYKKAREGVMKKTKGHYPATLEIIDVLQSNGVTFGKRLRGGAREKAMIREAQGFGRCAATDVSKNLIRIFFLTEMVKKSNGLPEGNTVQTVDVQRGAVLGAGVMGGGIAQLFAAKGITTRMKDLGNEALETGMKAARALFHKQLKRRRISKREFSQKMNLIAPTLDYTGMKTTEVVVEAIVENMDIKKKVLAEMETYLGDSCVVATNTSSLSVTEMQTALKKPERFVGMHFFNPVHRMPLVEVIRGEKTNDEAVARIYELSKKLGKTPIVVKDAPGFLVNRLLLPYLNEAAYLVEEGVPIPELDQILLEFGMPMGPIELIDEVGVDVCEKVGKIFHESFGARALPSALNGKLTSAEYFGKKNGKGFYAYKSKYEKTFDSKIYSVLDVQPKSGVVSREEIVERCIFAMINEAARCLDEGVVDSAAEVDLGMIMGTGFPPFRGGLLRYADSLGAKAILERVRQFNDRYGARFEPAKPLEKRSENGLSFYPENG